MTETRTALPARFANAPRATSHGGLVHTCNPGVHSGLPFGRKAPETCARCWELVNGAAPRADHAPRRRDHAAEDARRSADLRDHFTSARHLSNGCGLVCTYGDW